MAWGRRAHINMPLRYGAGFLVGVAFAGLTWGLAAHRAIFEPIVRVGFEVFLLKRQVYEPADYGFAVGLSTLMTIVIFASLAWALLTHGSTDRKIDRYLARKHSTNEAQSAPPPPLRGPP